MDDAATARMHRSAQGGQGRAWRRQADRAQTRRQQHVRRYRRSHRCRRAQLRRVERRARRRCPTVSRSNKKLLTQFERRKAAIASEGDVDWGTAEALAFASLLTEGHADPPDRPGHRTRHVQPPPRGVARSERRQRRRGFRCSISPARKASFEIHNSPLSEYACLGFEYGYSDASARTRWCCGKRSSATSTTARRSSSISSSPPAQAKWGQTTRLTMLLPHGYEGGGPEHSSARLERFSQLVAEGNISRRESARPRRNTSICCACRRVRRSRCRSSS